MVNLSSHFQYSRDRVAALTQHFDLSNCRSLIILYRKSGQSTEFLEVQPRPIIQPVSPSLVQVFESVESIKLELEDLQTQVSRAYQREMIAGKGISYLIDASVVNGEVFGGFYADLVPGTIIQEKPLHWELILRRRP